jgi:hypothetical protein
VPDGVNQRWSEGIEFLAQVENIGFDNVRASREIIMPGMINDSMLREDSARIQQEESKETELGLGKMDGTIGPPDFSTVFIHDQIGKAQSTFLTHRAAKHGLYSGYEPHH